MKFRFYFLAIIGSMLLLGGCSKSDSFVGVWERNDSSEFIGIRVSVEKLDTGEYRGVIVKSDKANVFKIDDIKWKGVKKVKENEYEFSDLGTDGWYSMRMTLGNDQKSLSLRNLVDTGEVGSKQPWIKVLEKTK